MGGEGDIKKKIQTSEITSKINLTTKFYQNPTKGKGSNLDGKVSGYGQFFMAIIELLKFFVY